MGNRRLGGQRLQALMKRGAAGIDSSYQAGTGVQDAIVSHGIHKTGKMIMTEICIDLGGKNGADIRGGGTNDDTIGLQGGSGTCELLKWEEDVHGLFVLAEVFVAEAATTVTAMSLITHASALAVGGAATKADLIAGIATNAGGVGVITSTRDFDGASDDYDMLDDGDFLHLCTDNNSTTAFDAGRLVIRLFGIDNTDTSWAFGAPYA